MVSEVRVELPGQNKDWSWRTLVIVLEARNEVCLVARLLKATLLKQLLQVWDLEARVVGHLDARVEVDCR